MCIRGGFAEPGSGRGRGSADFVSVGACKIYLSQIVDIDTRELRRRSRWCWRLLRHLKLRERTRRRGRRGSRGRRSRNDITPRSRRRRRLLLHSWRRRRGRLLLSRLGTGWWSGEAVGSGEAARSRFAATLRRSKSSKANSNVAPLSSRQKRVGFLNSPHCPTTSRHDPQRTGAGNRLPRRSWPECRQ